MKILLKYQAKTKQCFVLGFWRKVTFFNPHQPKHSENSQNRCMLSIYIFGLFHNDAI